MEAARFLLAQEDEQNPPAVYAGCQVTPLINAREYFQALSADLTRLGRPSRGAGGANEEYDRPFLYIAGYVINLVYPGDPLMIPGPQGPVRLLDVLIDKARSGVDVRVLAWIPWPLALADRLDVRPESADNMRTVLVLREEPALQHKVCLNLVSHPVGSAHAKLVVMGQKGRGQDWAVGYTGGIDFSPDRAEPDWLDVQARVEGPVVQEMYDFFGQMWNQNLVYAGLNGSLPAGRSVGRAIERSDSPGNGQRVSRRFFGFRLPRARHPTLFRGRGGVVEGVVAGTPPVEARRLPQGRRGDLLVQPLLTLPAFKYAFSPLLPKIRVAPLQFAPLGKFEVRAGLKKAILAAEQYIYIEDQYLWSQDVMRWINTAVRQQPELRVILMTGESDQLGARLEAYRSLALAQGLLVGLDDAQHARIGVYQHKLNVHAKTTLIDDRWAMIGSANIAQRSLYTDLEHNLAVIDPAGEFTRQYRVRLWGSRLELPGAQQAMLNDLACAFQVWKERWGEGCLSAVGGARNLGSAAPSEPPVPSGPSVPSGPPVPSGPSVPLGHPSLPAYPLRRIDKIVPQAVDIDLEWYQMVEDPDSRRPWYFPLRREYPQY